MTTFPASVLTGAPEDEAPATPEQLAAIEFEPLLTMDEVCRHGRSNADWLKLLVCYRLAMVTVTKSKAELIATLRSLDDGGFEATQEFVEHCDHVISELEIAIDFVRAAQVRNMAAMAVLAFEDTSA